MKNNQGFAPILIVLIVIGILVLGGVYYFSINKTLKPIACTEEAKVCPDGSAVGRAGPSCEFAECPAVSDETAGWKTYQNPEGGYLFKYPEEWNAVTNKYNSKNALFGPGATSESGYGGVESSGTLLAGQSLKDFVKEFNKGLESGSISETETTVSGQAVVVSILPKAAAEPAETKSVSFEKDGKVFNVYLMYKTDFAKYPEDEQRSTIFNEILSTFKFVEGLNSIEYKNTDYGFAFSLPATWTGYSVVKEEWHGYKNTGQGDTVVEKGPQILIRHPQWTAQNPRQDIPIMVFTISQWDFLMQDKFHIGAAPINPGELGRNTLYVFALPARYNYAFPTGWEEVEKILGSHPLNAF